MKIAEEGIATTFKPIMFFEGNKDHRLPVCDQSLRLTGAFKAISHIIGHCALHARIPPLRFIRPQGMEKVKPLSLPRSFISVTKGSMILLKPYFGFERYSVCKRHVRIMVGGFYQKIQIVVFAV